MWLTLNNVAKKRIMITSVACEEEKEKIAKLTQ